MEEWLRWQTSRLCFEHGRDLRHQARRRLIGHLCGDGRRFVPDIYAVWACTEYSMRETKAVIMSHLSVVPQSEIHGLGSSYRK